MSQYLIPGIIGISTYVDSVYHREMQLTAAKAAGCTGPINQLQVITATLDFNKLLANLQNGLGAAAEEQVAVAAAALEAGGADFVVVTSGTTSTLTARARDRVSLDFLDLAEAAWGEVGEVSTVGVLSTRHAAAGGIFQAAADRRGAILVLPSVEVAARVDEVIFDELVHGQVSDEAVRVLEDAVARLGEAGAEAVILGNTDMTLAAGRLGSSAMNVVDSARAHARAGARAALRGLER